MKKQQDRKKIVEDIKKAAALYKTHLVGKKFLYIFDGRYIEVIYKTTNFRHLTGVATDLSAKTFYDLAIHKKLQTSQIYFTPKHPFLLCKRKIKHICEIATLAGSKSFMLEEIVTNTKNYRFGTTNLHFTLCLNKELDALAMEKSECFVVESLRDEDCFSKSKNAFTVTHIFSKANQEKKYTNLLYMDSSSSLENLPEHIRNMLDNAVDFINNDV